MTMLQPFTGPMRRRIASVNSKISGSFSKKEDKEDVSRVAAWAVSFDSLLRDKSGLKLFTVHITLRSFTVEDLGPWNLAKLSNRTFIYSTASVARTLMARLPRMFRTRSRVPWKKSIAAELWGKFKEFLKREFSEENIDFWKDCEDYKDLKDASSRKRKAKAIFEKYMTTDAPRAVNIDDITKRQAEARLENPSSETFMDAQTKVFYLMKQDSYSRFLKSDLYKNRLMNNMEKKMQDLRVSMDTKGDSAQEKKGGSLQRHFKTCTTTVNSNRTDNKENEENHQNSWIRRRMDSVGNILKRNKRNRH